MERMVMAAKFKLGDVVEVPDAMPGVQSWWVKKPATGVRKPATTTNSSGFYQFTDPSATNYACRFYQLRSP